MGPKSEAVSTRPKPCGKAEFTCSNHKCIPAQLQCDLFDDCGDGGSDEQDCKACMCSKLHAIPKSLRLICRKTSNIIRLKAFVVVYMETCCTSGIVITKSFRLIFQMSFFLYTFYLLAMTKHQKTKKNSHHAL